MDRGLAGCETVAARALPPGGFSPSVFLPTVTPLIWLVLSANPRQHRPSCIISSIGIHHRFHHHLLWRPSAASALCLLDAPVKGSPTVCQQGLPGSTCSGRDQDRDGAAVQYSRLYCSPVNASFSGTVMAPSNGWVIDTRPKEVGRCCSCPILAEPMTGNY